jgi:NAD(P)-dependent dehydrogenase (short-subunit alcohol dehydrogenase family)
MLSMHAAMLALPPPGSARGIGFNSARMMAALGATVYLADVDTHALRAAADSIKQELPGWVHTAAARSIT